MIVIEVVSFFLPERERERASLLQSNCYMSK
jgi:hypothetical protein